MKIDYLVKHSDRYFQIIMREATGQYELWRKLEPSGKRFSYCGTFDSVESAKNAKKEIEDAKV